MRESGLAIEEIAPAKVNLVLEVGPAAQNGLHEVASLFASIDLADAVRVEAGGERDSVSCAGVSGPNLAEAALAAFRQAVPGTPLPPLAVTIEKRIPVAAGLGGGSADAAAVLRAANALAGEPLSVERLREVAAPLGSDVPSQVAPGHSLVGGTGERVEPVELPPMAFVLVPAVPGLSAAEVYAEADRIGAPRERLDLERLRALSGAPLDELARVAENDLEPVVLSLRPELEGPLRLLRRAGAHAALVSGSGPTTVGVFGELGSAEVAAARIPGALVAPLRSVPA